MNEENTKTLIDAYPQLWGNLRGGYFECGDGWYDILEVLSATISTAATYDDFVIVKEKFGYLCIQGIRAAQDDRDYAVEMAITMAESLSVRVCEECGCPGQRRSGGWIRTLCDDCDVRG